MPVPLLKLCPPVERLTADAELLGRFVAVRDEAAFAELVRRHGPVVYRVCRRLVPAHVEDAFQAVFLILACRAATVRNPAAVGSWLVGTAGRVARQLRKAERCRAGHERGAGRDAVIAAPPDAGELAAVLDDELARLSDELRDPAVLCLVSGRTHEQAAADLGTSVRTLRRRLDRARAVLRARLERRGVVPVVAIALVAGAGEAAAAVPPALVGQTVSVVFQFLDGGAPSAAVAVAKGVMDGMAKFKLSALAATVAVALVCLGVAWSQDRPAPLAPPAPVVPNHAVDRPLAGGPDAPATEPERIPARGVNPTEVKTANFVVHAPTPMMARVIAAEAEHHRRTLALKWLGRELPPWPKPCVIRFTQENGDRGGATVFTFGKDKDGAPAVTTAEMSLRGSFVPTLASTLPHEVTHTVLASYFGKPVPRWADEGTAVLSESDDEQVSHDARARELLNAGRGIRLKALFRLTEYPRDMIVVFAQGHSVARFLAGKSLPGAPGLEKLPHVGKLFQNSGADGHRRLIAFLQLGADGNTAESWDKAAKAIYGFESVDVLEEAWLEWLAKPESALVRPEAPRPAPAVKPSGDLIPPIQFPAAPSAPPSRGGGR